MAARLLMRLFVALSVFAVVGGLAWVYIKPPESMRVNRDGVPYLSPPVVNPVTGQVIPLEQLVQHYKKRTK